MVTKRKSYMAYLDQEAVEALKKLSTITRVPASEYVREAIDDLLAKYKDVLKQQQKRKT